MNTPEARSNETEWGCLIAPVVVLLVIAFAVLSLVKQVDADGPVLEREAIFLEFGTNDDIRWGGTHFTITYAVGGDIQTSGVWGKDAYVKLDPSAPEVKLLVRDIPMRNLLGTWHGGKTEIVMTVPDWGVDLGMPQWRGKFLGNRQALYN